MLHQFMKEINLFFRATSDTVTFQSVLPVYHLCFISESVAWISNSLGTQFLQILILIPEEEEEFPYPHTRTFDKIGSYQKKGGEKVVRTCF